MKVKSLNYRPEIDGLRAVAVLLVIFHHLGFSALPGGYVGVDVFFVISGYLITRIIAGEIKNGSFSIKNFYKRRIIRLAPAYFVVLGVTTLASFIIMLPSEFLEYVKSATFSTFFSANFFMWREVGGYFGIRGDQVPLLHLWSLAVEEQFYIFWPITLLILYKVVKPKGVLVIVAIAVLVGIGVSEWGVNNYPAAAYYLMPTRAFELLIGALVALKPFECRSSWGLPFLGVVLIIVPAVTYTKASFFPGLNALAPCLGTALIIAFSSYQKDAVGRFLATEPMNYFGRISYPAYLWHWPIIVFLKIYQIDINVYIAVGVIFATLSLSALTYRYIEKPSKKAQKFAFAKVAGADFALPAAAFVSFSVFAATSQGWPERFDQSLNLKSEAILSYSNKIRGRCNEGNVTNPLPPDDCIIGLDKPGVDILLIGDSYANHFTGMIDVMAKDASLRGYDITQSQTIYLPGARRFYSQDGKIVEHKNFYARNRILHDKIKQGQYRFVILGGAFVSSFKGVEYTLDDDPQLDGKSVFKVQFEKAVLDIISSGAVPYIIKGNPIYSWAVQDCTLNNQRLNLGKECNMSYSEYKEQFEEWNDYLAKLLEKYPKIHIIDPALVMCDSSRCYSEINGVPLYRDHGHLNDVGSRLIGQIFVNKYGNPFTTDQRLTGTDQRKATNQATGTKKDI